MFKNVGRELKNWAKFLVIIFTIPWGIVALSFLFMGIAEEEWALVLLAVLLGPIIVVIGYFFARLTGIMLYAFGELVENTKIMKDALTVNTPANMVNSTNHAMQSGYRMSEKSSRVEEDEDDEDDDGNIMDKSIDDVMNEIRRRRKKSTGKYSR